MKRLRAAVIGVGYLGRFHAQKYAALDVVELVAVVDNDMQRAREVADEVGCRAENDFRDVLGEIDVASVVVPTQFHFDVASACLQAGVHVLLEKPITPTLEEADRLIELARSKSCILQIGHLERFNPAVMALQGVLNKPQFIESQRMAPFKPRGTDVNVVLDLMIHDIDIILSMVPSDIKLVNSVGVPVLSDEVDIANARLQFDNGCVANVTASRASRETVRKIRIFQEDAYISIDYQQREISIFRKGGEGFPVPGLPGVAAEKRSFEQCDTLMEEITSFVEAVRTGSEPVVSGEDGKRALDVATQISGKLWHEVD